jgi:hypothetical protein
MPPPSLSRIDILIRKRKAQENKEKGASLCRVYRFGLRWYAKGRKKKKPPAGGGGGVKQRRLDEKAG